mgnify:CR=1 FL=1
MVCQPQVRASALAFRELAKQVAGWTLPEGARGTLEFFVERLVHRMPMRPTELGTFG